MAQTFQTTTGLGRLRSYCVQVEAGLKSKPELKAKAADWQALKQEVVAYRATWEGATDALTEAQTVNRVNDSAWDAGYTIGSGIAYLLSDKEAKGEPYASVMRVPARRAIKLGYAKATGIGQRAINEALRAGKSQLADWAEAFTPTNAALAASGQAMADAEDGLDGPRAAKRALVRKLNTLVAVTEAFVLTQFPGQSKLADAILVPSWSRNGGGKGDGEDDTSDPVLDDDTEPDDAGDSEG